MPIIDISTKVRKLPSIVYEILRDMERFPDFMHDAREVKIIRRTSKNIIITKWVADIDGTPIEWKEKDIFDDGMKKVKFMLVEGDFKKYEGMWTLSPSEYGTRIRLRTHLEWGVPNIEKYVGRVLEEKACRSVRGMLWLIRKRANKGQ